MLTKVTVILLTLARTVYASQFELSESSSSVSGSIAPVNWLSDCEYTKNYSGSFSHGEKLQLAPLGQACGPFNQNECQSSRQANMYDYWSLEKNTTNGYCSIMAMTAEVNFTLTTFLTKGSFVLVAQLTLSNRKSVSTQSIWIEESGWATNVITFEQLGRDVVLGAVITIFNPGRFAIAVVRNPWSKTESDVNVSTSEHPRSPTEPPSKSLGEQMKEFNIFLLTIVAGLIVCLMVFVIIVTCIQRRCPPCSKGPSIDDPDEIVDFYDEDDLLCDILDARLRFTQQLTDQPQQELLPSEQTRPPIFFSSNWPSAFRASGEPIDNRHAVQPSASTVTFTVSPDELHSLSTQSIALPALRSTASPASAAELEERITSSSSTQALIDSP